MSFFLDNIFYLDVHYVCMLVQRFEPQGSALQISIIIIIYILSSMLVVLLYNKRVHTSV